MSSEHRRELGGLYAKPELVIRDNGVEERQDVDRKVEEPVSEENHDDHEEVDCEAQEDEDNPAV